MSKIVIEFTQEEVERLGLIICSCGHPSNNHFMNCENKNCAFCSCKRYNQVVRYGKQIKRTFLCYGFITTKKVNIDLYHDPVRFIKYEESYILAAGSPTGNDDDPYKPVEIDLNNDDFKQVLTRASIWYPAWNQQLITFCKLNSLEFKQPSWLLAHSH